MTIAQGSKKAHVIALKKQQNTFKMRALDNLHHLTRKASFHLMEKNQRNKDQIIYSSSISSSLIAILYQTQSKIIILTCLSEYR